MQTAQPASHAFIRHGTGNDYIDIGVEADLLTIRISGAPTGEQIKSSIRDGLDRGWLSTSTPTLVDMRAFDGSVDWEAIRAVRGMADWGAAKDRRSCVAYVSTDRILPMLMKVVGVLFPQTDHRVFADPAAARHWLETGETIADSGPR